MISLEKRILFICEERRFFVSYCSSIDSNGRVRLGTLGYIDPLDDDADDWDILRIGCLGK